MPAGHKPPGVNVVEKHGLPNKVVAAATTGLTLVGHTVKTGRHHAGNLLKMPVRPTSMAEFQRIFGGAHRRLFHQNADDSVTPVKQHNFLLYLARHFSFGNAGYQCCAVAFGARIDPETNLPPRKIFRISSMRWTGGPLCVRRRGNGDAHPLHARAHRGGGRVIPGSPLTAKTGSS